MINAFSNIRLTNSFVNATGGILKVNDETVVYRSQTGAIGSMIQEASGVLNDRLYQTGQTLISLINSSAGGVSSLNGASGIINITGTGNVTVISGGVGLIYISGSHNDGIHLSGNLQSTGQTLYTYITNTSGNLDGRIYQTGSSLYNLINNFSGVFNSSGAVYQTQINTLTTNLALTGISLKDSINFVSGNLITTGQTLDNKINSLSGQINTALVNSGNNLYSYLNIFSGNTQFFSTGMTTGFDNYRVDFPLVFTKTPRIFPSLEVSGNILYSLNITGRTVSSFYALFSDVIAESGVVLHVHATIN